jgi:hypothetical protein
MKSSNYPEIDHPIVMVKRDNEIIIALPDGEEIASLTVCTMEKDEKQPDGKFKDVPTKNFWLMFTPSEKCSDSGMKDCAAVMIE